MAYPNGVPSSGVTNPYDGSFTPLEIVASIKDNQTSIDKMSLARSIGTQVALIQNYVNSTYLGRANVPVQNGFITNLSGTNIITSYIVGGTDNGINISGGKGRCVYTGAVGIGGFETIVNLSGIYIQSSISTYFSATTLSSSSLTISGSPGILTLDRTRLTSTSDMLISGVSLSILGGSGYASFSKTSGYYTNSCLLTATGLFYNYTTPSLYYSCYVTQSGINMSCPPASLVSNYSTTGLSFIHSLGYRSDLTFQGLYISGGYGSVNYYQHKITAYDDFEISSYKDLIISGKNVHLQSSGSYTESIDSLNISSFYYYGPPGYYELNLNGTSGIFKARAKYTTMYDSYVEIKGTYVEIGDLVINKYCQFALVSSGLMLKKYSGVSYVGYDMIATW